MFQTFEEFLATSRSNIPVIWLIINLSLTAVLAFALNQLYIRYGSSLSNRRLFGKNFLLLSMTTMLIITIVKSSLALSLGLVGALSIIRFRAAIKEPEELAYLFLAIAIGLGFGANQGVVTLIAFMIISIIIILVKRYTQKDFEDQYLNLTVSSDYPLKVDIDKIVETLEKYCSSVSLKRLDESDEILETSFLVEFHNFQNIIDTKEDLRKLDKKIKITLLDNQGLL
jgi:hypothetical protein